MATPHSLKVKTLDFLNGHVPASALRVICYRVAPNLQLNPADPPEIQTLELLNYIDRVMQPFEGLLTELAALHRVSFFQDDPLLGEICQFGLRLVQGDDDFRCDFNRAKVLLEILRLASASVSATRCSYIFPASSILSESSLRMSSFSLDKTSSRFNSLTEAEYMIFLSAQTKAQNVTIWIPSSSQISIELTSFV